MSRTSPRRNSCQKTYRTIFRLPILTLNGVVFRQAGIDIRAHNLRRFALAARANQGLEHIKLPSVRRWWYPRLRYRRKEETNQAGHIQGRLSNCSISCSDKKRIISEVKESHSEERIHIRTPSSASPGSLPDPTIFQTPRTNPLMDGERANELGQSLT